MSLSLTVVSLLLLPKFGFLAEASECGIFSQLVDVYSRILPNAMRCVLVNVRLHSPILMPCCCCYFTFNAVIAVFNSMRCLIRTLCHFCIGPCRVCAHLVCAVLFATYSDISIGFEAQQQPTE